MPFNPEKFEKFINQDDITSLNNAEADKLKKIKDLQAQEEITSKLLDGRLKTVKSMLELGIIDESNPQFQSLQGSILQLMSEQTKFQEERVTLQREEFKPDTEGEEVFFPDETDPTGFSSMVFPEGYLPDILSSPERLRDEVARLEQLDDEGSQQALSAIQSIVQQNSMDNLLTEQNQDILEIDQTGQRPNRRVLRNLQSAFGSVNLDRGSKANAPVPTGDVTIDDLGTAIRKVSARRDR